MSETPVSPYDGLNLPQLLDLMHDPVVPEVVSWWPQTQGWWILGVWLIAVAGIVIVQWVQWFRRNRYRREALARLEMLEGRLKTTSENVAGEVATLLKRTALAAYPRNEVADLFGPQWAEFLVNSCGSDPVVEGSATALAQAAYRQNADSAALIEPARRWIRIHRA